MREEALVLGLLGEDERGARRRDALDAAAPRRAREVDAPLELRRLPQVSLQRCRAPGRSGRAPPSAARRAAAGARPRAQGEARGMREVRAVQLARAIMRFGRALVPFSRTNSRGSSVGPQLTFRAWKRAGSASLQRTK